MKTTIQEGLQQEVIIGRYTSYSILTSEEGYCFYEKTNPTYDEEGKEIETPIQYMRYCSTPETSVDEINKRFISIPIHPEYEIV